MENIVFFLLFNFVFLSFAFFISFLSFAFVSSVSFLFKRKIHFRRSDLRRKSWICVSPSYFKNPIPLNRIVESSGNNTLVSEKMSQRSLFVVESAISHRLHGTVHFNP